MATIRADQLAEQLANDISPVTEIRASDLQEMNEVVDVPKEDFDLVSLLQVDQSIIKQWETMGEIDEFEQSQRYREGDTLGFIGNLIPGVSAGIDITNAVRNTRAMKRIEENNYGDNKLQRNKDMMRVQKLMLRMAEEQVRGFTTKGNIMRGVIQIPSFVGGFGLTKGVAKVAGLGASKAMSKAVAKAIVKSSAQGMARTTAGQVAAKGIAKTTDLLAGAAAQTAAVGVGLGEIPRVAMQRQEASSFQYTDKGLTLMTEGKEKPFTSFMKATGIVYTQLLTERTGEIFITPGINSLANKALPTKIAANLVNLHKRVFPDKNIRRLLTVQGFDGFISELGEEQIEKFMMAMTGIQEFGTGTKALDRLAAAFGDREAYLVEAGVITIGSGFQTGMAHGVNKLQQARGKKQASVQDIDQSVVDGANELLSNGEIDEIFLTPEDVTGKIRPPAEIKLEIDALKKKIAESEEATPEQKIELAKLKNDLLVATNDAVKVEPVRVEVNTPKPMSEVAALDEVANFIASIDATSQRIEDGDGNVVANVNPGFPDALSGYKTADIDAVLKNVKSGKKLTPKQEDVKKAMLSIAEDMGLSIEQVAGEQESKPLRKEDLVFHGQGATHPTKGGKITGGVTSSLKAAQAYAGFRGEGNERTEAGGVIRVIRLSDLTKEQQDTIKSGGNISALDFLQEVDSVATLDADKAEAQLKELLGQEKKTQTIVEKAQAVKKKAPTQERAHIEKETAEDKALRENFEQTEKQVEVEKNLSKRVEAVRKKFKSPAAQAKAEVKEVQRELISLIRGTELEHSDLGKFISKPTQTLTVRQLMSKLPAIEKAIDAQIEKAQQRREIARFKRTTAKKKLKKLRPEFRKPVEAIIEGLSAVKKSRKKLASLAKLRDLLQSEDFAEANVIPDTKLVELSALDSVALRDMSSEDIKLINDSVGHFIKLNELKNKLIVKAAIKDRKVVVDQILRDYEESKSIKDLDGSISEVDSIHDEEARSALKKIFNGVLGVDTFNMELILEILDGTDKGLSYEVVYEALDTGVTDQLRFIQEGGEALTKPIKDINVEKWSRAFQTKQKNVDTISFKFGGDKVALSKGEAIALYLHTLNKNNLRHITEGGFSFPGKLTKVFNMTAEDVSRVQEVVEKDKEMLRVAQSFNTYLNTTQKNAINKVSMNILGFELALEDNYFRISVNPLGRSRQQEIKKGEYARFLVESLGFLKPRLKSGAPIILDDAFVVMTASIKQAGAYVGLAQPLRSVKAFLYDNRIETILRQQGRLKHLENLRNQVEAIEGESVKMTDIDTLTQDWMNKADAGILGANIWVIGKQVASYPLAMTEINPKYFLHKVPIKPSKATLAEVKKFSPQIYQRMQGFISREVGEVSAVGEARHLFTGKQLVSQKVMAGIKATDTITINAIWLTVKAEVAATKPSLEGDAYLEAVAKRAEEVIRRTQPTFHLKDRSAIGSSKNWVTRLFTKYSSQRNKNAMIQRRAAAVFNRSHKTPADYAKLVSKLFVVNVGSALAIALMDLARDMFYDRDEEEKRLENFLISMLLIPLGNIYFVGPIVASIVSKIKKGSFAGYDVSDPLSSTVDELTNAIAEAVRGINQAIEGEVYTNGRKRGEEKWKSSAYRVYTNSLDAASKIRGVPLGNARRLLEAGYNQTKKLLD